MLFGQIVMGPPGSGKTTYCQAMQEFLTLLGRKVVIVNLDPANDNLTYTPAVDISNLITVEDAMTKYELGPNGALVYCMEYLEANVDWLMTQLRAYQDKFYFMFDLPGQVELYTHHRSVKNIVSALTKLDIRLCAVHLVDSHYCSDAGKFIAVLLTSLNSMLQMELPQINVLSKVDLAEKYGRLEFGLDYYTDVLDLGYILTSLQADPFMKPYFKLNKSLVDLVESYSLVSFHTLNINDKACMMKIKNAVDKCNGYIYGDGECRNIQALLSCAVGAEFAGSQSDPLDEVLRSTGGQLS